MTLNAVLHKRNQYEFLEVDGGPKGDSLLWNETADAGTLQGAKRTGWLHAKAVADGILGGTVADPTGGATYFISSNKYVRGKPFTLESGFHRQLLTEGRFVDAPYISISKRRRKSYFFIESPEVSATPSREKTKT